MDDDEARDSEAGDTATWHNHPVLFALDASGTFVLGAQGALAAIAGRLDLVGIAVLAVATALGGGIIRDLLIGAAPPQSLRDWRYISIALGGAVVGVIVALRFGHEFPPIADIVEAGGLSLVAIAGAEKALEFKLPAFIAILLAAVSGVGGGTIRDILLARVPVVLHTGFYASAALIGAAVMIGCRTRLPAPWSAAIGAATVFGLRIAAITFHWSLPTFR